MSNDKLEKLAEEYAQLNYNPSPMVKHLVVKDFKAGYIVAQTEMEKREKVLLEKLEAISKNFFQNKENYLCGCAVQALDALSIYKAKDANK